MPSCKICINPQRSAIERLLIEGQSERTIANRFGITKGSLHRHKTSHLPNTLVKAKEAEVLSHGNSLLEQVKSLQASSLAILLQAQEAGDLRVALGAIQTARQNLELVGKLTGEFEVQQFQQREVKITVHYHGCTKLGEHRVKSLQGGGDGDPSSIHSKPRL
ncbi:hypothetical protein MYX76_12755 [Desulfobacterota bacterium AH_259_B03_O07]|nr:hypothetical protein [Desulfobacterota bacterium AH_259_B03_O07]